MPAEPYDIPGPTASASEKLDQSHDILPLLVRLSSRLGVAKFMDMADRGKTRHEEQQEQAAKIPV